MKKISSSKAFTLIELLAGAVIIAVISAVSWSTIALLTKTTESSRSRSVATNLLQRSMEEVRRVAQTNYNGLSACLFPEQSSSNQCNFKPIKEIFSDPVYFDFQRSLTVTDVANTQDLKEVTVAVSWNELSQPKQLYTKTLLARPAGSLPGNIIGTVKDEDTGELIEGVEVRVTKINGPSSATDGSSDQGDKKKLGANFDFSDNSGTFTLAAGDWNLFATHKNYKDYKHPGVVVVASNNETFVNFKMELRPDDAVIDTVLYDRNSGQILPSFSRGAIKVFDDGSEQKFNTDATMLTNFQVKFSSEDERCFTMNTVDAYKAEYSFESSCVNGLIDNEARGYSTAKFLDNTKGNVKCGNPYNGNSTEGVDRICVKPGDKLTINEGRPVKLFLNKVPTTQIKGEVIPPKGFAMDNSKMKIYIYWHDGTVWNDQANRHCKFDKNKKDGRFVCEVPTIHRLFPTDKKIRIQASLDLKAKTCCNQTADKTGFSNTEDIGYNDYGDVLLYIGPVSDDLCGNVKGKVTNAAAGHGVPIANVTISSFTQTNGGGNYLFACHEDDDKGQEKSKFRLPVNGNQNSYVEKAGYYSFFNAGNAYYAPKPGASIQANKETIYDVRLWPIGFGNVKLKVRDGSTGSTIDDAIVVFNQYTGTVVNVSNLGNGEYSFTGIIETWPPKDSSGQSRLPNDSYFQTADKGHVGVKVSHPNYVNEVTVPVPLLRDKETLDLGDILLFPRSGM